MRPDLEYYRQMRLGITVLTILLVALFSVSVSAQANGVPPSVTSFGFGGQPGFQGVPPSVTSLGPRGATPAHPVHPVHPHPVQAQGNVHQGHHGHHHEGQGNAFPYYAPYYVPYYPMDYTDAGPDPSAGDQPEPPDQYEGGPTIFDRRGSGERAENDYVPTHAPAAPRPTTPVAQTRAVEAVAANEKDHVQPSAPATQPEPAIAIQPSTTLIFKDGHKQEVGNYAIVGANLYDLTPGRRQKVALADLDLDATQKINDDLGNDFKLPQIPGN